MVVRHAYAHDASADDRLRGLRRARARVAYSPQELALQGRLRPSRRLHLVGVYSDPSRDPRGHAVSVAYTTHFGEAPTPNAGSDAEAAEWVKDWRTKRLAFDHSLIITDAEKLCGERVK